MKAWTLLALTAAALMTSACGYRGDLQRPPPMWGDNERGPPPASDRDTGDDEEDTQRAPLP